MIILSLIGFIWITFEHSLAFKKYEISDITEEGYNPFEIDTFDYDNDLENNQFEEEAEGNHHKLNPYDQLLEDSIPLGIEV